MALNTLTTERLTLEPQVAAHAEAMIAELVASYGVHTLTAVLKRPNHRSLRLLVQLGFAPGTDELAEALEVQPDELLMVRSAVCQ